MFKRLYIYYKERYPLLARLLLGMIVFGEIYFIILLNYGVLEFRLGMQEVTGAYTVFSQDSQQDKKSTCKAGALESLRGQRIKRGDLSQHPGRER